jgi:hypothetical protein
VPPSSIPSIMPARDFNALSLIDLLEAREAAHVHLARKEGVIATAIGRYLIRENDPNSRDPHAVYHGDKADLGPRRLDNSVITKWSWPCVLVFVRSWREIGDFREHPENFISPSIDLPDGRQIPVCVVEAAPQTAAWEAMTPSISDQPRRYCGGVPVYSEVQGHERFGTLGCLVTDGTTTYALTAAHVAGRANAVSKAFCGGELNPIGIADEKHVVRQPFEKIYPTLPGKYVDSCLDAGLIRVSNIGQWSAAVHGIGPVGELISIDMNTLSLSLIGAPVRAHGAASGLIEGQILALFFRYQALGGYDYVADLLIGPRRNKGPLRTRAGDSGSIFFYDHVEASAAANPEKARSSKRRKASEAEIEDEVGEAGESGPWRPLALQWGGQRFFGAPAGDGSSSFPFALATSLSTICRELSVEIIRGWDVALPEYWGEVGHFTIGGVACDLISDNSTTLKDLFRNNRVNIGFDDASLVSGHITNLHPFDNVPLADVPDDVWRSSIASIRRPEDAPTHYSDMDRKGAHDLTLFQICENPDNIKPSVWLEYYQGIGTTPEFQGSLPFRIKQIFELMVQYIQAGKVKEYVCASGILAHYVGDACQPLHASRLHNKNGVHSPYETFMLNENRGANGVLQKTRLALEARLGDSEILNGAMAAERTIGLMRTVRGILSPEAILEVWNQQDWNSPNYTTMWQSLGTKTGECMAEGALLLASLWQSAWRVGNGDQHIHSSATIPYQKLSNLFRPNGSTGVEQFLPSLSLSEYED